MARSRRIAWALGIGVSLTLAVGASIAYGGMGMVMHLRTLAILLVIGMVVSLVRMRPRGTPRSGRIPCQACGYDLAGTPGAERCPECGTRITYASGEDHPGFADRARHGDGASDDQRHSESSEDSPTGSRVKNASPDGVPMREPK
ncbi:MAG: hypothetical protein RBS39_12845 [Phycisphaerales bacterium]|nr:hypothetical protein [Phycisphaerales bacterium]